MVSRQVCLSHLRLGTDSFCGKFFYGHSAPVLIMGMVLILAVKMSIRSCLLAPESVCFGGLLYAGAL